MEVKLQSTVKKRGYLKEDFPRLKVDPVSALLIRTIELLLQVWGVCVPRKPGQAAATTTFPAQMLLQKVANGNNFNSDSRSFLHSTFLIRINRIDSMLLYVHLWFRRREATVDFLPLVYS